MTLCIGALARAPLPGSESCIVLGFDYKLSNDLWGSESEYKLHKLSDRMLALFAGSPGRAKELALMYRDYLATNPLRDATARQQLAEPWTAFKRRLADAYIQRRLAFSYQELLDHGERWLGLDRQQRYLEVIDQHDPNVQMIFAGFIGVRAVLFRLCDEIEECTNFALIGTGAMTAEPTLHTREHRPVTLLEQALYNVYEAKKVGELSPAVGQRTRMLVVRPPRPQEDNIVVQLVTEVGEKHLQKLYRKHGPKPMRVPPQLPEHSLQEGRF